MKTRHAAVILALMLASSPEASQAAQTTYLARQKLQPSTPTVQTPPAPTRNCSTANYYRIHPAFPTDIYGSYKQLSEAMSACNTIPGITACQITFTLTDWMVTYSTRPDVLLSQTGGMWWGGMCS